MNTNLEVAQNYLVKYKNGYENSNEYLLSNEIMLAVNKEIEKVINEWLQVFGEVPDSKVYQELSLLDNKFFDLIKKQKDKMKRQQIQSVGKAQIRGQHEDDNGETVWDIKLFEDDVSEDEILQTISDFILSTIVKEGKAWKQMHLIEPLIDEKKKEGKIPNNTNYDDSIRLLSHLILTEGTRYKTFRLK